MTKRRTKAKTTLLAEVHVQLGAPATDGPLGKVERAQRRKRADVPASDEPVLELRRLVQDHKALTKKATAIRNMTVDKKNRTTGEPIPSRVPADRAHEMLTIAKALQSDASRLESAMTRELRKVPIYAHLLQHVYGLGPVVCAYLVAMVDVMAAERATLAGIRKADSRSVTDQQVRAALEGGIPLRSTKISNVRRFCGLAVVNGRLERPTRGVKLGYCAELRTRLYQAMAAMWKNSAKKTAERPNGATSKYLDVWRNYKHRMLQSERYDAERNVLTGARLVESESGSCRAGERTGSGADQGERAGVHEHLMMAVSERGMGSEYESMRAGENWGLNTMVVERPNPQGGAVKGRPGARAIIHATGWHKAADVLIEDIYTVWRTIEGLPIWPSYYAAKLGFNHGGSICVNAPKLLTVEEALAVVGDVGARPAPAPVEDVELPDEEEEDA